MLIWINIRTNKNQEILLYSTTNIKTNNVRRMSISMLLIDDDNNDLGEKYGIKNIWLLKKTRLLHVDDDNNHYHHHQFIIIIIMFII